MLLVEKVALNRKSKELRTDRRELVKLSLIKHNSKDTYQLHSLIRGFFRSKLSESDSVEKMKLGICRVMVAVAKEIPQTSIREQILAVKPAIAHLEEVGENLTDWLADDDLIWLFVGLGRFYKGQGYYQSAQPWYEKCLNFTKSRFGSAHPDIATSLNNLASLYKSQGRYSEAEPLYKDALEMSKQLLGSAHPSIATSLNNLASLYKSQGRYSEAEPLYKDALEMRKQLLGSAHPDIATSLNNLAG
ncbi:MAG: tetratricopeptide repeat protein, partial [Okeania sp. SIO3C4]|nr:tetratricopeptide repeat protein [Okeania sp. SIO3C4]